MGLTGLDPNDPTPGHRFEVTLGAGIGPGAGNEYSAIIFGNKTAAGSETADTLGTEILNDADGIARFGGRSEWLQMYRLYVAVAGQSAKVYGIAVTESVGATAANCTFTFATAATAAGSVEITILGTKFEVGIDKDDTATAVGTRVFNACVAHNEGRSPFTWTDGGPPAGVVTCTFIHKGPRGDLAVGSSASLGVRMRMTKSIGMTVTKSALTPATATLDDLSTAYAAAVAAKGPYLWILPCHATTTVTNTDNQIGEAAQNVTTQALPANGNRFQVFFGNRGTNTNATDVMASAIANYPRVNCFHAENCDWMPGMIAAHLAGICRAALVSHPSFNLAGYTTDPTRGRLLNVPAPYTITDRPTAAETKASLNGGVSEIDFNSRGAAFLVRHVSGRSYNGTTGEYDYKAREGHIQWAIDHFVDTLRQIYAARLQMFIAGDPAEGAKPLPNTSTPLGIRSMITDLIADYCGPNPLNKYNGPILAPDKRDAMQAAVSVVKITGGFTARIELFAVEHLLKSENDIREVGAAY